jgi:hypothetical protein
MKDHALGILLGLGIPACIVLVGSSVLFFRTKVISTSLQLLGAIGLTMVVISHIAEAFDLLPWMRWGLEHSAGHYLDLASAIIGLTTFPTGYLLFALARRPS